MKYGVYKKLEANTDVFSLKCEITEFPGFLDTQKHCWKPKFLTRISDWTPCKHQGFGKPERVSETQILDVSFQKETKYFFVISHPVKDGTGKNSGL